MIETISQVRRTRSRCGLQKRFLLATAFSGCILLSLVGKVLAMPLTGVGQHLPVPVPNPERPMWQSRTLELLPGGFEGTWTDDVAPDWRGTFTATGHAPTGLQVGMAHYDFTSLPTGQLPVGTFFRFEDVDRANANEIFMLKASDSSGNPILDSWLSVPLWVGGSLGVGDSRAMPGWKLDTSGVYTIDGRTETYPGNPNVGFLLINLVPIAELSVDKASIFYGLSLAAPFTAPESISTPESTSWIGSILAVGLIVFFKRTKHKSKK